MRYLFDFRRPTTYCIVVVSCHGPPLASCSSSRMALSSTRPRCSWWARDLIRDTTSFLHPFFNSRESLVKYLSMPWNRDLTAVSKLSVTSPARRAGRSTRLTIWTARLTCRGTGSQAEIQMRRQEEREVEAERERERERVDFHGE